MRVITKTDLLTGLIVGNIFFVLAIVFQEERLMQLCNFFAQLGYNAGLIALYWAGKPIKEKSDG